MTPPTTPSPTETTTVVRERVPFLVDVTRGIFMGDYAPNLGLSGHVAQAICGFIPIVQTICALRDFFACRRRHDGLGAFLNFLALLPFVGAIPKTAEVIRATGETYRTFHHLRHRNDDPANPAAGNEYRSLWRAMSVLALFVGVLFLCGMGAIFLAYLQVFGQISH